MSRNTSDNFKPESIYIHNRIDGAVEMIKLLEEKVDDHDVVVDYLKSAVGKISLLCLQMETI